MSDSDIKLCKDCKYCHTKKSVNFLGFNTSSHEFANCMRPLHSKIDYVSGKIKTILSQFYCSVERDCEHLCGPKGKFFVQKQTEPTLTEKLRVYFRNVDLF
jgi:hypothetical protein